MVQWGWTNCVRDKEIAQLAVDKKLTLISFESMLFCDDEEKIKKNVFHEVNELAGYSTVLHALSLRGIDGRYGNQKKTLVIGLLISKSRNYNMLYYLEGIKI